MKKTLALMAAFGLAATWFGCRAATDSTTPISHATTPTTETVSSESTSSDLTLVSLKVPNMT
ncbi:MAG: hypothetical protein H8E44_40550 [Planctomycetes bacterium]|nr:hypothetical protein [Planctomycetota bacterium]MBL7040649.1 hypothetical protein [Pirellulaceae bacterium]